MSDNVMTASSKTLTAQFSGLTNGSTYYARVYVVSPSGNKQSEVGTQVISVAPKA